LKKDGKPLNLMPQNKKRNNKKSLKNKEYEGKLVTRLEFHYLSAFNSSIFQKKKSKATNILKHTIAYPSAYFGV
jgi:DNA/RNA endonuclease G (NUC1)